MIIFKSKLYREEIKHWALLASLLAWAILASYFALRNQSKTLLIGIDDQGTRIIVEANDRMLQNELKNFLKTFLLTYYAYDEKNFSIQIEQASNLLSPDAWNILKPKFLELKEKLVKYPLTQNPEIESIDLIDQGKVEAILKLNIISRIAEQTVKLKVRMSFVKNTRSQENPWGFEITEVTDSVL